MSLHLHFFLESTISRVALFLVTVIDNARHRGHSSSLIGCSTVIALEVSEKV